MIAAVIVDFHTHIFPPHVAAERKRFVANDATFRELYQDPAAKLASADDLLESMDAAGIDVSVALGFAWRDPETCRHHNDDLLDAAARSRGRIVPFCTLPLAAGAPAIETEMQRCVALGAKGFGELRPENLGFDLVGADGDSLAAIAEALGAVLLFHVSEPVGHAYAGKHGLALAAFHDFTRKHQGVRIVGAHWGGGLPFFAAMPEVKQLFDGGLHVDTAASSLLYDEGVYASVIQLTGAGSVLFGSDYPLLSQKRSRRRIEESGLDEASVGAVLGGNATSLLGLE